MNSQLLLVASVVFVALSAADIVQSIKLQKRGAVENNPLLGKHPKPQTLLVFGVLTTVAWLAAALWLNAKGAPGIPALFALAIFLRLWTVSKGYKLGKDMDKLEIK